MIVGVDALFSRLGDRLVTARQARGLTQQVVAQAAGITRTSLTNIEAGRQHSGLHTFLAIAAVLDVPYADLIGEGLGKEEEDRLRAARDALLAGPGQPVRMQVAVLEARLAQTEALVQALLDGRVPLAPPIGPSHVEYHARAFDTRAQPEEATP